MSANLGPKITSNGLMFSYDIADRNSYTSGSTLIRDLVNNTYNGVISGSPTFSPTNIGSLNFSGFSQSIALTSSRPSSSNFTVLAWIKQGVTSSGYRTIYADNNRGLWLKNSIINWFDGADKGPSIAALPSGSWLHIGVTYNGTLLSSYVTGSFDTSSNGVVTQLPTSSGTGIAGHGIEFFNGDFAKIDVYNRALTSDEIYTSYRTIKSRFGL